MEKIRNILIGFIGGILLAFGFSRANERLKRSTGSTGSSTGSSGGSAEHRLWRSANERIDNLISYLGGGDDED